MRPSSSSASFSSVAAPRARFFAVLFCSLAWVLVGARGAAPVGSLRAGAASCDITPTEPVLLAGYAGRKELSTGVHDPLGARALAFASGDRRLVLVSVDVVGFRQDSTGSVRGAILEATGLAPSELFLCAVHTHSAPRVTFDPAKDSASNVRYSQVLRAKLVDLVGKALDALAPAAIGTGAGASPVAVNRRLPGRDRAGKPAVLLARNPSVLTDREVQVLKVARPGAPGPFGALFAYATHSTSLGGKSLMISGDVHGLTEQFVERHLGDGVVVAGFAGASGDVDPWFRVLPGFRTAPGWIPEPVLLGTMLGEEVATVLEGIEARDDGCEIRTLQEMIEFPLKGEGEPGGADPGPPRRFALTVACMGEVAFVGLGGEVFNEIGASIKAGSPFARTFVFTHCNSWAGYVPTTSSYAAGGYEIRTTPYAPGVAERLVERVSRMLRALRDGASAPAGSGG